MQRQRPPVRRLRLSYKVYPDDVGDDGVGAALVGEHLDIIDAPNVPKLACFQRVQQAPLLENSVAGDEVASAAMAEVGSERLLLQLRLVAAAAVANSLILDLTMATVVNHLSATEQAECAALRRQSAAS